MAEIKEGTRFSGADWATELKEIILVGVGGIGSWTALNLSRIGHELFLIDPDEVDNTNVTGGQMYRTIDVGKSKVIAIQEVCRQYGAASEITPVADYYSEEIGMTDICICGLDNMKARREVFESWVKHINKLAAEGGGTENCLFIDGRLTMEMFEIFAIQGNNEDQIRVYEKEHLFTDEEAQELDCTTKQSTFGAMGIACFITTTLCNFLTNKKLGMDFREVPFYHRQYLPIFSQKMEEAACQETLEKEPEELSMI